MAERKEARSGVTEAAKENNKKRDRGIGNWLMSHGLGWAAAGGLGVAGYLAIFGGTAAAAFTAPLFVTLAGAVAVAGLGAAFFGVGAKAAGH